MSAAFFEAYLAAFGFGVSIAFGALILLAITGCMKARWFYAVRPLAEAIAGTLPLYIALFVPIALGLRTLYPFAYETAPAGYDLAPNVRQALVARHLWMNPTFFVVRGFGYLIFAAGLAEALRRVSPRLRRRIAAGSLPLLAFVLTFAGFDWLMARSPVLPATCTGCTFLAVRSPAASARSVSSAAFSRVRFPRASPATCATPSAASSSSGSSCGPTSGSASRPGGMADLPHEVPFYAMRVQGSWLYVSFVLGFGHFAIPFLLLLSRARKKNATFLAAVGGWIVLMHAIDHEWLVVAATRQPSFLDIFPFVLVAAAAVFVTKLRLTPSRADDPALQLALRYESS